VKLHVIMPSSLRRRGSVSFTSRVAIRYVEHINPTKGKTRNQNLLPSFATEQPCLERHCIPVEGNPVSGQSFDRSSLRELSPACAMPLTFEEFNSSTRSFRNSRTAASQCFAPRRTLVVIAYR
jgi:hypothetical protein